MDDRKMEIIQQLMEELQEEMKPSSDELGMRLGRPKVDVVNMHVGNPDMAQGDDDQDMDMDMSGKMDGDDDSDMGSPDEMLKRRLMKLRE